MCQVLLYQGDSGREFIDIPTTAGREEYTIIDQEIPVDEHYVLQPSIPYDGIIFIQTFGECKEIELMSSCTGLKGPEPTLVYFDIIITRRL